MTLPAGVSSLLWFVLVAATIPAALWLLKRTPLAGAGGQAGLRSVAALALSPSQRIVTVEVGSGDDRRWLVLGVTAQSITTLHSMAPQPDLPGGPPQAAAPAFAQVLGRLRARRQP